MSRNNLEIVRAFPLKLVPPLDSRNFLNNARDGQIRHHHWLGHCAGRADDVGWIYAEVAGTIARRHPDRARTHCVLFSHRHLHHTEHPVEPAILDLPALGSFG